MLFHVRMNVNLPPAMPTDQATALKQTERELAQRLQQEGKWRHLWRIAGSVDELHTLLTSLPLFPYMQIDVMPLCRHPSSIHDDDR
jgi:muconolactone D-isomerase